MRIPLFATAIVGLLVSGYLLVTYLTGGPIICGEWGSCEAVRGSAYASFAGLPTPAYGVIFYLVLAIGAVLATPDRQSHLRAPLALLTAIGVVVSAVLTYIEAFVIHAWCVWCVVSAVITVVAFIIVWTNLYLWRAAAKPKF